MDNCTEMCQVGHLKFILDNTKQLHHIVRSLGNFYHSVKQITNKVNNVLTHLIDSICASK